MLHCIQLLLWYCCRYGAALGVSGAGVAWALGHAVSRSYGSGPDAALLPYIDLINHDRAAARPAAWEATDGSPAAAVFAAAAAEDEREEEDGQGGRSRGSGSGSSGGIGGGGGPEPEGGLAAGTELCVSYIADAPALTMFLNFGFVPAEHRAGGGPPADRPSSACLS